MAKNFNELRAKMSPEAQAVAATRTKLTRYECAVEVIGSLIAIRTAQIAEEEGLEAPKTALIELLRAERSALAHERQQLSPDDDTAIEHIYRDYAPQVKAYKENGR